MAKYIVTYCPECQRNTTHKIYVEDGYGVSGISRIFSNLISLGLCNIGNITYYTCLNCGNTKEI